MFAVSSFFRQAAGPPPPPLPNPETRYKHWFHGTNVDFHDNGPDDEYDDEPGGRPRPQEPYVTEYGENAAKHWNTDLGLHFSSHHEVAATFAQHHSRPLPNSRVAHCRLHMANPKHYDSEFDLTDHAIRWAHQQGHHIFSAETRNDPETDEHLASGLHISELPYEDHEDGRLAHLDVHTSDPKSLLAIDRGEDHGRARGHQGDHYLAVHPEREVITEGFRRHLEKQGHDGITYGNEYEGPKGHTCAIAFEPDQIHMDRWEWLHPEHQDHAPAPRPTVGQEALVNPSWSPEHKHHWVDYAGQRLSVLAGIVPIRAFHATHVKDWAPAEDWHHVGTPDAALHRAVERDQIGEHWESHEGPTRGAHTHIHEVELHGRIYPHVLDDQTANDMATDWNTSSRTGPHAFEQSDMEEHGLPEHPRGYTIFPYRNDTEDQGSISYLAHHSAIKVTGTHDLGPTSYSKEGSLLQHFAQQGSDEQPVWKTPRPKYQGAPEGASDDEILANGERQRAIGQHWTHETRKALSRGDLSAEEAKANGYSGHGHDQDNDGLTWKPLPQTLYHTTTHKAGVLAEGLKSRNELSQRGGNGLGGGEDDTISFTHDPEVAEHIHRALHEYHSVLTGKTTPHDLMRQAKEGGFEKHLVYSHGGPHPDSGDWKPGDPYPQGLQDNLDDVQTTHIPHTVGEAKAKWGDAATPHPLSKPIPTKDGDLHTAWRIRLSGDERMHQRSQFYKTFATWRAFTGGHMDPGFIGNDPTSLAKMDPRQFAVIRCHPKPGAQGYQLGSLGEWRTADGSAVHVAGVHESSRAHAMPHHGDPTSQGHSFGETSTKTSKTAMPMKPEREGHCYRHAFNFLRSLPEEAGGKMLHGSINDGEVKHHAWVQYEDPDGNQMIHEPTYDENFPAVYYHQHARPQPEARYSKEEAMLAMLRHNHYGPWHLGGKDGTGQHQAKTAKATPDQTATVLPNPYREDTDDQTSESGQSIPGREAFGCPVEGGPSRGSVLGGGVARQQEVVSRGVPSDLSDQVRSDQGIQQHRPGGGDLDVRVGASGPTVHALREGHARRGEHLVDTVQDGLVAVVDAHLEGRHTAAALSGQGDASLPVKDARQPGRVGRRDGESSFLPNPYREDTSEWFHGTIGDYDGDPHPGKAFAAMRGPSNGCGGPQMNKLLGVHFSPLHSVAHGFAGPYHGAAHGRVFHARLKMSNPIHFDSEESLLRHVWNTTMRSDHFHHDQHDENMKWNYDRGATREGINERLDTSRDPKRAHGAIESYLQFHPRQKDIAEAYVHHLRYEGHDGITYGNNVEGPHNHHCAIAFDPASIEVTHVDRMHPRSPPQPTWPKHVQEEALRRDGEVSHSHIESIHGEPEEFLREVERYHNGGLTRDHKDWYSRRDTSNTGRGEFKFRQAAKAQDGHVQVYRGLHLTEEPETDEGTVRRSFDHRYPVGSHWTTDPEVAEAYAGGLLRHKFQGAGVVLHGRVDPQHIVAPHDVPSDAHSLSPDSFEKEVYIRPGAPVHVHKTTVHWHGGGDEDEDGLETEEWWDHAHEHHDPPLRVTAMGAAGPDYDNLTFDVHPEPEPGEQDRHALVATHPEHGEVGRLSFTPWNGQVSSDLHDDDLTHLEVHMLKTEPGHTRRGVASQLMRHLDRWGIPVEHGTRTADGEGWARGHYGENPPAHTLHGKEFHYAGQRGDLPEGLEFKHVPPPYWNSDSEEFTGGFHAIQSRLDGKQVGYLHWYDPGEGPWKSKGPWVEKVEVATAHRRKGLGAEMMRRAKEITPGIKHSEDLTSDGRAWRNAISPEEAGVPARPRAMLPRLGALLPGYTHEHPWLPTGKIFAPGKGTLDARLFDHTEHMRPAVKKVIFDRLDFVLSPHFPTWQDWSRVYLAGSEASEWWGNNDFDTLIGVNYPEARKAEPALAEMSDDQISDAMNAVFRARYNDEDWVAPWDGQVWHLTGYVNPDSWDIRKIKPYAAYDMTRCLWVVRSPKTGPDWGPAKWSEGVWDQMEAYLHLITAIQSLPEPDQTRQGAALYDFLHSDRRRAFSKQGTGWNDPGNVIWKALDLEPSHPLEKLVGWKRAAASVPDEQEVAV